MSIEIHVKMSGTELPELKPGRMRYVIADNGTFLERATPMFTSSVLLDESPPEIDSHHQKCVLHFDPMPVEMVAQMAGFFREAYELHGGEAALILLYYPLEKRFEWYCPVQTIEFYFSRFYRRWYAGDSIEYDNPLELPPGAIQFGDAHSHHESPTPSWIDKLDESHQDGFHIILGNITGKISWHIDFAIDGTRFAVPTHHIFGDIPEAPYPKPPAAWMKQIRIVKIGKKSHIEEDDEDDREDETDELESDETESHEQETDESEPDEQESDELECDDSEESDPPQPDSTDPQHSIPQSNSPRKSGKQLDCDKNYGSYPHKGGGGDNYP